jgi:hypothetical protein
MKPSKVTAQALKKNQNMHKFWTYNQQKCLFNNQKHFGILFNYDPDV